MESDDIRTTATVGAMYTLAVKTLGTSKVTSKALYMKSIYKEHNKEQGESRGPVARTHSHYTHKTVGPGEPQTSIKTPKEKAAPKGGSTAGVLAIVHFGSVGRLCGLFERSKAT